MTRTADRPQPRRPLAPLLLCALACLAAPGAAPAEDRGSGLLPENSFFVVEIQRPLRLIDHPLLDRVREILRPSDAVQRGLQTPEYDRVAQVLALIEDATGTDWRTALDRLTAGGIELGVVPGPPPQGVLVLTAADSAVLDQLTERARRELLDRLPEDRRAAALSSEDHRGVTCWHAGQAWYAVHGNRLVASGAQRLLTQTLDKLLDGRAAAATPEVADDAPVLRAWVDLKIVRLAPQLQPLVATTSGDPGQVAFLGGWIDLLRRADEATVELSTAGGRFDWMVRLPAGTDDMTAGLRGFFATGDGQQAAPPLQLPGTILTATWFRDYAALWEARSELLTKDALEAVEKGDADSRQQLSVFKLDVSLSDIAKMVGPHHRLVVARQTETPYRVRLDQHLPAVAFAADLHDEETFRAKMTPLVKVFGLILAFDQKISNRAEDYKGASLTTFRFRDDPESAATGNRARFNASPTVGITRGHFVIGSTREIVRQVVDELDRQAGAPGESSVTEQWSLSFEALADVGRELRDALTNNLALEQGFTVEDSERELSLYEDAVRALGGARARTTFDRDEFVYHLSFGPAE